MKKLFLFIMCYSLAVSFSSCSGSDDSGPVNETENTLSMKVDGVLRTFGVVTAHKETGTFAGITSHWYVIEAYANDGASGVIFNITQGDLSNEALQAFDYMLNGNTHGISPDGNFTMNVVNSTDTKIKGTFSGTLYWTDNVGEEETTLTITEGTFDINVITE